MSALIDLVGEDLTLIAYRPRMNNITGGVLPTILCQQIMYRWKLNNKKAFFKFKEACKHPLYKQGDSWCEELSFTKSEFDSAIKKIGIKLNTKTKNQQHSKFVEYWINSDRLTFYTVNEVNLNEALLSLFSSVNQDLDLCKSKSRYTKSGNPALDHKDSLRDNSELKNIKKEITREFSNDFFGALGTTHQMKRINKQKEFYRSVNNLRKHFERLNLKGVPFVLEYKERKLTFKERNDGNHWLVDYKTKEPLSKRDAEEFYKVIHHRNEIPLVSA